MRLLEALSVFACAFVLTAGSVTFAAAKPEGKPAKKLTCCEEAEAKKQECRHRCCLTAHRKGESCQKCNPNREDLKILKKKAEARGQEPKGKGQEPQQKAENSIGKEQKAGMKAEK